MYYCQPLSAVVVGSCRKVKCDQSRLCWIVTNWSKYVKQGSYTMHVLALPYLLNCLVMFTSWIKVMVVRLSWLLWLPYMISLWYQNKLLIFSSAYMHCCNEHTQSLVVLSEISEVRSVCFKPICARNIWQVAFFSLAQRLLYAFHLMSKLNYSSYILRELLEAQSIYTPRSKM